MKAQSLRFAFVALTALASAGCQSGPRWAQMPQKLAWWKKDTPAATESSLVARSAEGVMPAEPAAPVLPSTQATPQSLTAQATPPSAKSVAATTPAVDVPPVTPQIPANSAATIAAAPVAAYPSAMSANTLANTPPASPPAVAAAGAAPATTVAQVGPYDPNAYQAATTGAANEPSTQIASVESDRYGASSVTTADNRYVYNSSTAAPQYATTAGDDRYGMASSALISTPTTTPTPPSPTTPTQPAFSPPPITPVGASAAARDASSLAASDTVRIDTPAGQYRPGGTSTYTGSPATSVEVASRPATPPPATSTKPLPGNVPIYPTGNTTGRAY